MPTEKGISPSMISYKFAAAFARALVSCAALFSILKPKLRNDNACPSFYVYVLRLSEVCISWLGVSHGRMLSNVLSGTIVYQNDLVFLSNCQVADFHFVSVNQQYLNILPSPWLSNVQLSSELPVEITYCLR